MIIKTKTKIAGALAIYRVLRMFGLAAKAGTPVQVRRSGVLWSLDLGEGIDFSIYLLGAFERSTLKALRRLVKPGYTVFDIGANIGAHTLHLANAVGAKGCVFAFEPTNFAFDKLTRNLALNPDLGRLVTANQVFLVDDLGTQRQPEIYSSWPLEGGAGRHPKHLGRRESTSKASVDTLDSFVARHEIKRVDLIKIDVDGHEYPVLKGGRELLKRFAPILVMELSPYVHSEEGNDFRALIELLAGCGYSFKELDTQKPLALDSTYLNRKIPDGAGINVIGTASVTT
jgi:FkbM family methyltransferase